MSRERDSRPSIVKYVGRCSEIGMIEQMIQMSWFYLEGWSRLET